MSGTNVKVSICVTAASSYRNSTDHPNAKLDTMLITLGSRSDALLPLYTVNKSFTYGQYGEAYIDVVFASNHFSDGEAIPVKVQANFLLTGTTSIGAPLTAADHSVVAYNRGLATSTGQIASSTSPSGYEVPATPTTDNWDTVSTYAANDAITKLVAMGHANLSGATRLKKSQLLPRLKEMTAYFGFTHGEVDGFLAGLPESGVATDADKLLFGSGYSSVVGQAVSSMRTAPPPNMVILHACDTLTRDAKVVDAFGLTGRTDAAYAGFDFTVWSLTYQNVDFLSEHAKNVYQMLLDGKTIDKAVASANGLYPPMDNNGTSRLMIVRGDKFARLYNVYTGDDILPTTLWYKVKTL